MAAGTKPTITFAGDTIRATAAFPAEIRGLTINSTGGNAIDVTTAVAYSGASTLLISGNTFGGVTAGTIDVNPNAGTTGTVAISIQSNTWSGTHTGNGIDVATAAGTLTLDIGNNSIVATGIGININPTGGSTTFAGFLNNNVSGNTGGTGISMTNATIRRYGGWRIQRRQRRRRRHRRSGNPVGGSGLALTTCRGDLSFTDLDVYAATGAAFSATSGADFNVAGSTGLRVAVNSCAATFDADAGPALNVDRVQLNLQGIALDSAASTTFGVSLVNTDGSTVTTRSAQQHQHEQRGRDRLPDRRSDRHLHLQRHDQHECREGRRADQQHRRHGRLCRYSRSAAARARPSPPPAAERSAHQKHRFVEHTDDHDRHGVECRQHHHRRERLTFRSISSNGAANGIFLNNTGTGGLTVTGNGGTCTFATPTCTGGRIQSTVGADNTTNGIGVYLQDAQNVSLTRMRIDNHPNFAIRGHVVNNFTLQNVVIDGNNGTNSTADMDIVNGEDSVRIINLTGSALIDSSFIGGGYEQNLRIVNNTGSLNRLTVNNCSIGDLDGAGPGRGVDTTNGDDNITFATADGTLTQMNGTFTNNILNNARGDVFQAANSDLSAPQAAMDVVFRNNTVSNNHPNIVIAGGGVTFNGTGAMTYDISCNKFRDSKGHGLNVFKSRPGNGQGPGGTWSGTIFNNRIGVTGVGVLRGLWKRPQGRGTRKRDAYHAHQEQPGLQLQNFGHPYGRRGCQHHRGPTALTMNATVIGNTTSEPDPANGFAGFHAVQGAVNTDNADATTTLNLKLGGAGSEQNNFLAGDPANSTDVAFQRGTSPILGTFNLTQGASGVNSPVDTVVRNNNVNTPTTLTVYFDAGINVVGSVPALPALTDQTCFPASSLRPWWDSGTAKRHASQSSRIGYRGRHC